MTALWAAVALLAFVVLLLSGAYVHLARKVRFLGDWNTAQGVLLGTHDEEIERHDDILVEHTKQLDVHCEQIDELFGERAS